ncbi:hypothetical protein N0B30_23800 [Bacillus subtilis]|uniref:hypothetical protein n=1 Tax=Bacillus TaxID=1386 RepID=UPI00080C3AF1|nr:MULTISPECIES: hypothetical protein [Bacillus subtilis group]MCT6515649.1 hypothetical protein [Bacillus subtilis]OCB98122.1 hypothetical protein SRCM101294_00776 [Bacillus amyloliquefaciens]QEO08527.1 hypothetical protein FLQ07_23420 [Bacillus paralicheniformis]HEO2443881.1 hypothetical protein [Streptococcus agalactiae]
MSDYPFKHGHGGSIVYKKEQYSFRFKGIPAADIVVFDIPGSDAAFSFEIEQNERSWPHLPDELSKKLHSGDDELTELGFGQIWYESKEAALQAATDAIEHILQKYQNPDSRVFLRSKY